MKYSLICIFILILCSCTIKQEMSDDEIEIIKRAISFNETSAVADAKVILNRRIKRFNLKNDLVLKVQLLVVAKEYDTALETSEQLIKRFPDYIEMIVLHCVLSKYILPSDEASIIYQRAVKKIQIIAERIADVQQQYNAFGSLLLLHCLFNDIANKQLCLVKINGLQISQEKSGIIEQISKSTESELFEMCNIY